MPANQMSEQSRKLAFSCWCEAASMIVIGNGGMAMVGQGPPYGLWRGCLALANAGLRDPFGRSCGWCETKSPAFCGFSCGEYPE